jgi:hypothetical protein
MHGFINETLNVNEGIAYSLDIQIAFLYKDTIGYTFFLLVAVG